MRLKLFLALATTLGVGAATRMATLPPYDPTADIGKVAVVGSSGYLGWSTASGVSGAVVGPTASTNTDLAQFSGTTGKVLVDSGIPSANVVLVSRGVLAGTGLTVTNSGLLTADITMSLASGTTKSVMGVTGATGSPTSIASSADGQVLRRASSVIGWGQIALNDGTNAVTGALAIANGGTAGATAASGFQNLSPQTTKGDLIGFSTVPLRFAVGTTGQLLGSDSTAASGLLWTSQHIGTATNDAATAGYVGETFLLSKVRSAGPALSTGTVCNVGATSCPATGGTQSITVTAGDWQICAGVGYKTAATTSYTSIDFAVSKTSNTMPGADVLYVPTAGEMRGGWNAPATVPVNDLGFTMPCYRASFSSSTALFLVADMTFTVSTVNVYGYLEARRMR